MMTLQEEEEEEALRKKEMGAVVWRSGACSTSTAFCGANKPLWQQLLVLVLMQRLPRLLSRQCSRSHEAVGGQCCGGERRLGPAASRVRDRCTSGASRGTNTTDSVTSYHAAKPLLA